jgi:Skp family chaperone for outer membrane proteins
MKLTLLFSALLLIALAQIQAQEAKPQTAPIAPATPQAAPPPIAKPKPVPRDLFFELKDAGTSLQLLQSELERTKEHYQALFAEACRAAAVDLAKCTPQDIQPEPKK